MKRVEELKQLLDGHWRELALDQEKVELDPCWEIYQAREEVGELMFITIRENGKLMGYFVGFVAPGLHYRGCLTLIMDVFWLHPDLRGEDSLDQMESAMYSDELFNAMRAEATRRGVQRIFVGSKLHKDASMFFERLGYAECERYYSLWIGE